MTKDTTIDTTSEMATEMATGTATETATDTAILTAAGIRKSFPVDSGAVDVLPGVDLSVGDGEFVAVMGPSGSGKSTLLYSVSGLDEIDAGSVTLAGVDLTTLSPDELADSRREQMGFVFQQPTLLRDLGLLENIVLTSSLGRVGIAEERVARAKELMTRAGIWELRDRLPTQVSGGQLQRAGICRALMHNPRIVFGDEPTGSLNSAAAAEIMDLLSDINSDGTTLMIVTHDVHVAARADRVVFMSDGRVVNEVKFDVPRPDGATAGTTSNVRGGVPPHSSRVDEISGRLRRLGI